MTAKTVYSGTTHNVGGPNGYTKSADGFLDLQFSDPHPAAENFFGAAWSGCFMGAIGLAAAQKKVALPEQPTVDATIDLLMENGAFFLRAKLDVSVPGIDPEVARELVDVAHEICPYSKATRGNIEVQVNLVEPAFA
jgi:Ohr subfamily peroxiredoxin